MGGQLVNGVVLFGIAQSFFLGFIILLQFWKNRGSLFLGILLIVEGASLAEQFFLFSGFLRENPAILGFSYPFAILKPLLVYMFTSAYFRGSIEVRPIGLLHLLPFVLYFIALSPLMFASLEVKAAYVERIGDTAWFDSAEGIIFFIIHYSIYSVYFLSTFKIIRENCVSLKLEKNNYHKRIANFVILFLCLYIVKLILYLFNGFNFLSLESYDTLILLFSSFTIQLVAWFIVAGSKWPSFKPTEHAAKKEVQRVRKALDIEKVFLDDTLTIKKLSMQCGIMPDRLSELIQFEYQASFKETINHLRVNEAKKLIQDEAKFGNVNLLGIAVASGFNNKVTFYRAFKKSTGLAPSSYLKSIKSK